MNIRDLAREGAKARLIVLMKEIRTLVKMFPGIADEEQPPKPKRKWSAARRKAQSERMKARNPKHKGRPRRDNASGPGN